MTAFLNTILIGGLHFQADGFRIIYALIAVWMWALTSLFSLEYFRHEREHLKRYAVFTILTFAATEGVMFSADLLTTFFFFEILSLTSFVWVIHEETREAIRAAKTYFFIAIIGGLTLFMGLALMYQSTGTLRYDELHAAIAASPNPGFVYAAGICILLGFGAKAGMFPLHIWLPKSHPVAPSPASALLSGILTKVGIFGILMTAVPGFFGNTSFGLVILLAGTVTMALGALLALFSVNLKRTLACSSMSQIGFILVGTGTAVFLSGMAEPVASAASLSELGGAAAALSEEAVHLAHESMELAHSGLVLHMVNHSLIKLTLFMAAGVFVMNLHKLNLNEIRGYGRKKPLLLIPFVLGALGISGVPFFNGYISKTLLHEGLVAGREALVHAASEAAGSGSIPAASAVLPGGLSAASAAGLLHGIEWIFLVSGGLTFAYMLKLFICIFVEKPVPALCAESGDTEDSAKETAGMEVPGMKISGIKSSYMTLLSTIVLLLSALLLPVLGQPAVSGRVAAWMTGDHVFAHFHAFSWTNLSGSFISLGIGACVYLLIVRHVLMRAPEKSLKPSGAVAAAASSPHSQKIYADLWPRWLDLEDLVYRPALLTVLPAIGGAFASFFAENRILRPLCLFILKIGGLAAQFLSVSTDGLLILFHDTFMRERVVRADRIRFRKLRGIQKSLERAYSSIAMKFSFTLMMTCLGIIVILAVILAFHYM